MTPGMYIALARDIGIVLALGYILWYVHRADTDHIEVKDFTALKAQLEANSKTVARWAQEARHAQDQRTQDMDKVTAAIGAQRAPIVVLRNPPRPSTMPVNPAPAANQPTQTGGADPGLGIDLRPQINRLELKYEAALADCRAVLSEWPQ